MISRTSALPLRARLAVEALLDDFRHKGSCLDMAVDDLSRELDEVRRLQSEARKLRTTRQTELRLAATEARWQLKDPEAVFRLSVELDRALAGVEEDLRAIEPGLTERGARLLEQREQARSALAAVREQRRTLEDTKLSSHGLAPWDAEARRAQRVLDNEASQAVCTEDEDHLLHIHEVVDLFKKELGVSRSQFYQRYRPLLRPRFISQQRLVYWSDGSVSLDGHCSQARVLRSDAEALVAFLRGHAS
jgi:hypothetical protein